MRRAVFLLELITLGALCACGRTELVSFASTEEPLADAGLHNAGLHDAGVSGAGVSDAGSCPIPLDATVETFVAITADNRRVLWLNGVLIERTDAEWFSQTSHLVPIWRHPSLENVIAVEATNLTTAAGLDRGLLFSITLNGSTLVTDQSWRQRGVNDGGWSPSNAAWVQPGFDDSAWGLAIEQAGNGGGPWGSRPPIDSSAQWIWAYDSNVTGKVDVEPVLFRHSVYVSLDGGLRSTPSPCL